MIIRSGKKVGHWRSVRGKITLLTALLTISWALNCRHCFSVFTFPAKVEIISIHLGFQLSISQRINNCLAFAVKNLHLVPESSTMKLSLTYLHFLMLPDSSCHNKHWTGDLNLEFDLTGWRCRRRKRKSRRGALMETWTQFTVWILVSVKDIVWLYFLWDIDSKKNVTMGTIQEHNKYCDTQADFIVIQDPTEKKRR